MRWQAGVTLVELLVVIALLGIVAGVVGVTWHTATVLRPVPPAAARVLAARDSALRTGRAVTIPLTGPGGAQTATALPDGRVLAEPGLGIDPFTGRVAHAAR